MMILTWYLLLAKVSWCNSPEQRGVTERFSIYPGESWCNREVLNLSVSDYKLQPILLAGTFLLGFVLASTKHY